MDAHLDELETRSPEARDAALFAALPGVLRAAMTAPAYAASLAGLDPDAATDRAALARLPVLRKSDLPALHKAEPPFGGFVPGGPGSFARLFTSPGPIFEPQSPGDDPWGGVRALRAAGFQGGDIVLNTFSYHLVPAGFVMDSAARALGCAVIPAGPGNTGAQLELMAAYRPVAYCGTPDFLKILLDAAADAGTPATVRTALVSGAAFPPSLQAEIASRGVDAYQAYATADLGIIAYETSAREGLVINEDLIVEIVRPGTGDPVSEGEVGEIVVTSLDAHRPLIRFALGDLTAILPGRSPCGRTNTRIKGWMGRADQTAKVRGMFVRPEQVAEIGRRCGVTARLRLVIGREGETDTMTLMAEQDGPDAVSAARVAEIADALQSVTKLRGRVVIVAVGTLPNDGRMIADDRPVRS